jgi:hypothetical protein
MPESAGGRRRCLRRFGERRSCGRRGCGGSGRPRPFGPHPDRLRRRANRMKFGEYRIGINRHGPCAEEFAGDTDRPDRDGHRNEFVQRIGDRETAIGRGYGDRARRSAAGSDRRPGIDAGRRGFKLNLSGWRRRLEGVPGKRGAAGQAQSRRGNHDETTHGPSVNFSAANCHIPRFDHRSVGTATQPRGPYSLING